MHKIDGEDTVAVMPPPGAVGTPGWFDPGDPGVPREATQVTSDWANAVQAELVNLIEGAGITLDKADLTQLQQAVRYEAENPNEVDVNGLAGFTALGALYAKDTLIDGYVTADSHITSVNGNVVAQNGNVQATVGNVQAVAGNVIAGLALQGNSLSINGGAATIGSGGAITGSTAVLTGSIVGGADVTAETQFLSKGASASVAALVANSDAAGAPSANVRVARVARGSSASALLEWDETADSWCTDRQDGAGLRSVVNAFGTTPRVVHGGRYTVTTTGSPTVTTVAAAHGLSDFLSGVNEAIGVASVEGSPDSDLIVHVLEVDSTDISVRLTRGGGGIITAGDHTLNVIIFATAD